VAGLPQRPPASVSDPLKEVEGRLQRKGSFWRSLQVAVRGASYVLRTERNAQIECVIALLVVGLGVFLQISAIEWAIILLLIGLVLALEMVNTSIEAVVNLASVEYHALAKVAKDTAAGAVLFMAISSVAVGVAIFGPYLWRLIVSLV
jgi:diacylglycerol kinase